MPMIKSHSVRKGDPVVHALLDGIQKVSDLNPAFVFPDCCLVKDLGISLEQIPEILFESAKMLGIRVGKAECQAKYLTAREAHFILSEWYQSKNSKSA